MPWKRDSASSSAPPCRSTSAGVSSAIAAASDRASACNGSGSGSGIVTRASLRSYSRRRAAARGIGSVITRPV
jgi:hypothetical protein